MMVLEKAKVLMTLDGLISIVTTPMGSSPEIIADSIILTHAHTHTRTHTCLHACSSTNHYIHIPRLLDYS